MIKKAVKTKRPLVQAPSDKCFWVCNGQILKDLKELAAALENMAANIFKYHVNSQKNDFATWVAEVLGEEGLAQDMKRLKSAETMARKIRNRL